MLATIYDWLRISIALHFSIKLVCNQRVFLKYFIFQVEEVRDAGEVILSNATSNNLIKL